MIANDFIINSRVDDYPAIFMVAFGKVFILVVSMEEQQKCKIRIFLGSYIICDEYLQIHKPLVALRIFNLHLGEVNFI